MNILKLLLYPFATLYNGAMRLRNHLYDSGQKPSFAFETVVIAVGNLNVGGSGKTPMVEYLIQLLSSRYATVTLSRGYKRDTKGYRMAGEEDTAKSIGDEPLQMYRKFGEQVHVAVGEDRVYAIPHILAEFPDTRVLILDDALQQRAIRPSLSIMLTEFERPFFSDYVLPFGRLREARSGARRADIIVVTKCPADLGGAVEDTYRKRIERYAGVKPTFFTRVGYGEPVAHQDGQAISGPVVLVTGIAHAEPLVSFCSSRYKVLRHFRFADHHRYRLTDLEEIERYCSGLTEPVALLTTEKDMVKLNCPEFSGFMDRLKWYSMPIRQEFVKDGSKFDRLVIDAVQRALQP